MILSFSGKDTKKRERADKKREREEEKKDKGRTMEKGRGILHQ